MSIFFVPEKFSLCGPVTSENIPEFLRCKLDESKQFLKFGIPGTEVTPTDALTLPKVFLERKGPEISFDMVLKNITATSFEDYDVESIE